VVNTGRWFKIQPALDLLVKIAKFLNVDVKI